MTAVFLKLVNMSITASWLVLAVLLLRLLLKKAPKALHCTLWALVAIRLVCPLSLESSLSLMPQQEPVTEEAFQSEPVVPSPQVEHGFVAYEAPSGEITYSGTVTVNHTGGPFPVLLWLTGIWIAGMGLMLLYAAESWFRIKRRVAPSIHIGDGVWTCDHIDSPFILGFVRPKIYLPSALESSDADYVLAHERAHLQRRDHWWKPLGFLLLCVYWFNPLLWVAYILLCRDIELACDEKVVREMGTAEKKAYSTALLNCSLPRHMIAACPLAFGEVGVKARVKNVLNYKKPAFWVIVVSVVLCIIAAVCLLTNPVQEADLGYHRIESVTGQAGYRITGQESKRVNLVIEKDKLPEDCFTARGHTFEPLEVIPYRTYADNSLYLQHAGIDTNDPDYVRFTFAFRTDALKKGTLLLPYRVDIEGNGFVCNVSVNRGEVWDNQETYADAAYFEPVTNGEGFCVLVKKEVCEQAGHHIAFMLNEMNSLTYETDTAEAPSPVTITVEDVTSTGLTMLFHQNEDMISGSLICGHAFFLQEKVNDEWVDVPTVAESAFPDQEYDLAVLHHHGIDWEWLYGVLPEGYYRIGKEIPLTSAGDTDHTTVYAEFTIDGPRAVTPWFDEYLDAGHRYPRESNIMTIEGIEGMMLRFNQESLSTTYMEHILVQTEEGATPVISGDHIRNVYLTDLTGDGIAEVCATVWDQSENTQIYIAVYDYTKDLVHTLQSNDLRYTLTSRNDRLLVTEQEYGSSSILTIGILELRDDQSGNGKHISIVPLDNSFRELTEEVTCIDISNRKLVCLSSATDIETMRSLLYDLKDEVEPVPAAALALARADSFNNTHITVNYDLGKKTILFSKNFDYVWEEGSEEGYLIHNAGALRTFIEGVTSGVRNQETSGTPFAAMDAPWDWCAGISSNAISKAEARTTRYVTGNSSTGSSGVISADTLQELISILNQIPKDAFTAGTVVERESYDSIYSPTLKLNCAVSIMDGVNGLAVIIRYMDGKVEMLLTDELEKLDRNSGLYHTYLEPTQLWRVEDASLLKFMEELYDSPTLITYSVGAEYNWQEPLEFSAGNFTLTLRLIEGWEYEAVTNKDHFGIRCRPAGIDEGWICFSFWPDGYEPQEENRYISTFTTYNNFTKFISWPSDVKQGSNFSTYGRIWSYQKTSLSHGDYAVINDGADSWFLEYEDQINDIITLTDSDTILPLGADS